MLSESLIEIIKPDLEEFLIETIFITCASSGTGRTIVKHFQMKQRYIHESKMLTLAELYANTSRLQKNKDIQGSVHVQLAGGLAIKIVFVRNRNKKRDWLAILSTDCTLSDEEKSSIVSIGTMDCHFT